MPDDAAIERSFGLPLERYWAPWGYDRDLPVPLQEQPVGGPGQLEFNLVPPPGLEARQRARDEYFIPCAAPGFFAIAGKAGRVHVAWSGLAGSCRFELAAAPAGFGFETDADGRGCNLLVPTGLPAGEQELRIRAREKEGPGRLCTATVKLPVVEAKATLRHLRDRKPAPKLDVSFGAADKPLLVACGDMLEATVSLSGAPPAAKPGFRARLVFGGKDEGKWKGFADAVTLDVPEAGDALDGWLAIDGDEGSCWTGELARFPLRRLERWIRGVRLKVLVIDGPGDGKLKPPPVDEGTAIVGTHHGPPRGPYDLSEGLFWQRVKIEPQVLVPEGDASPSLASLSRLGIKGRFSEPKGEIDGYSWASDGGGVLEGKPKEEPLPDAALSGARSDLWPKLREVRFELALGKLVLAKASAKLCWKPSATTLRIGAFDDYDFAHKTHYLGSNVVRFEDPVRLDSSLSRRVGVRWVLEGTETMLRVKTGSWKVDPPFEVEGSSPDRATVKTAKRVEAGRTEATLSWESAAVKLQMPAWIK